MVDEERCGIDALLRLKLVSILYSRESEPKHPSRQKRNSCGLLIISLSRASQILNVLGLLSKATLKTRRGTYGRKEWRYGAETQ